MFVKFVKFDRTFGLDIIFLLLADATNAIALAADLLIEQGFNVCTNTV